MQPFDWCQCNAWPHVQLQASDSQISETLTTSATFLKRELPIRFAHRIIELDNLPHGMADQPSIRRVSEWYKKSFEEIRAFQPVRDTKTEESFTALLNSIYERHNPTILTMAKGIFEFRRSQGIPFGHPMPTLVEEDVHSYLDVFFTSRVGIRTLMSQHIAMHKPRSHYVGIINTQCRPQDIILDAIEDARSVCDRVYGDAPDAVILGDKDFVFSYVPSYLHHIAFELIKNSMRAVMETHGKGKSKSLPPVKIILSASADSEDVVIKISDEGGGIPRSGMRRIFSYFYTTAPPQFNDEDGTDFSREVPMAGLGVGLPLSRVYARYFGGDLQVISMESYGTDAYVFLRRLGDAAEPLSECANGSQLGEFAARSLNVGAGGQHSAGSSIKGAVDAIHLAAFPSHAAAATPTPPVTNATFRINIKKTNTVAPASATSGGGSGVAANKYQQFVGGGQLQHFRFNRHVSDREGGVSLFRPFAASFRGLTGTPRHRDVTTTREVK